MLCPESGGRAIIRGVRSRIRAVVSLTAGVLLLTAFSAQAQEPNVVVTDIDGPITPVVANHIEAAVEAAAETGAVLVVRIDTPGGLDTSMRDIVQTFLNAPIPVVTYVQPQGARAASAGTFITMAAHVAAMAPATSIGAATPVDLQEGQAADEKIINDAASFAITVAERRGRDAEFAEAAVRQGTSITASQALEQGVVDLIADNLADLLTAIDGMAVDIQGREVVLQTANAIPELYEMSTFLRILAVIADPNLAILFLSIGTLAVIYEAANPGLGFAGVAGVILLLLGFFALAVLPVQAAGVALLVLAIALFIGEIFVPGIGVLAAGGAIALVLAGLFLFEGPLRVSPPVLWPTAVLMGLVATMAGRAAVKARLRPATTGPETLVGSKVKLVGADNGEWTTFVQGTWWNVRAVGSSPRPGEEMQVVAVDGLDLIVEPIGDDDDT